MSDETNSGNVVGWPEWAETTLKEMYVAGQSGNAIARKLSAMGFKCSRNAVIGKAHRLRARGQLPNLFTTPEAAKVSQRQVSTHVVKAARAKATASRSLASPSALSPPVSVFHGGIPPHAPLPEERPAKGPLKRLEDLNYGECKWPTGDPADKNFGFCGCAVKPGSVYCEEHHAIAYKAAPPPKPYTSFRPGRGVPKSVGHLRGIV